MRLLFRFGIGAFALLAGFAVLQVEPAIVRNVVLETDRSRLDVGAVRTSLWSAAWAQGTDTFSLENVNLKVGTATYRMQRIDVSGATSSRADIDALLNASSTEPLADRLGRIGAKQITIPDLVAEQPLGGVTQRTIYRNVVATDVSQGRVASLVAETAAQEMDQASGKDVFTQGRTTISDLDLAALARLYLEKSGPQPSPMMKIYGAFSVDAAAITGSNGATIRIARMSGRDFLARPTQDSWSGTISLLAAMAEMDKLSSEDETRLIAAVTDLIDAMDFGTLEATGIDIVGDMQGPKDNQGQAHIDRIAYGGGSSGQPSDARLEGLEATGGNGKVKIDAISFTGFSFRPTIEGLRSLRGKRLEDIDPALMRGLIPTIGTIHVSGFSIDPVSDVDGGKNRTIKASFRDLGITADKPVNGIATNINLSLQGLAARLPETSDEEGIKDLIDLGYKDLNVSFGIACTWSEAASEIAVENASFQGQDMGSIALKGTLGGVTKDVFDPDTAAASVALMSAKLKSLDLTIENKGLFDRYLMKAARDQGTKPETLRRTYGTAATFLIPSMIGNSDQAQAISQAIARFIAKPGKITIQARTKDPVGIGVADIAAQTEPGKVLEMLDVKAVAE